MPNNNNKNTKPRRNRQRRRLPRNNNVITTTPQIPRNLRGSFPFPESRIVTLTAIHNFVMQASAQFVVFDFRVNSLYQFNVTGGTSHDFSGDTQLAAIYDSYHIQSLKVRFDLVSNEATIPVYFGLVFKDDQPSTSITTYAHALNALEVAPTTGPFAVGVATGMDVYRSRMFNISMGSIVGNQLSYNSDLSYTSSFGNFNPAQAVWMSAVAYSIANMTGGLIVNMRTQLTLRAYSIKTLQE